MFKPTRNRFRCHVERVKQRMQDRPLAFAESLSMNLIQQAHQNCNWEFRERVYAPWVTLWAFLEQVLSSNSSCSAAVTRVIAWLVKQGKPACSPEPSHYCAARLRLPTNFLREVFRLQYESALQEAPPNWKWRGKHEVKVVDGTTFSMPDTPDNRLAYPPNGETVPGTRFPIIRAVVLFSLRLGLVQNFAFGPYQGKGTGESSLFRQLRDCLQPEDVLLADKYYCSFRDVHELTQRGVYVAIRHFSSRTHLQFIKNLGRDDRLYCWRRPTHAHQKMSKEEFQQLPESLLVRVVKIRVSVPGFRVDNIEILTTLLDAGEYPAKEIGELYFRRWRGEMYLDDIKTTLGLDVLRCRSPEMIEKELIVGLLAHNTIRIQMAQAAEILEIPLHEISFQQTINVLEAFRHLEPTAEMMAVKLATIAHPRVGLRPGRSEPRAVKRKGKPYDSLQTPRPSFSEFTAA